MKPLYVVLSSDRLGEGKEELGKLLMGNFLKILGGQSDHPSAIFLINRGVYLATGSSVAVDFLGHLREQGVGIYICKTCVEYYGVYEEIALGEISGMGKLVEMVTTGRVAFI